MADGFHYSKGASCAIRERALRFFFLHRITVYLHSCEIAFLIENQICKTLGAFFFCNHVFLLLSDALFLVNNRLLSQYPQLYHVWKRHPGLDPIQAFLWTLQEGMEGFPEGLVSFGLGTQLWVQHTRQVIDVLSPPGLTSDEAMCNSTKML